MATKRRGSGKANKTGRSTAAGHWTQMVRETMETPAWRALPTVAQSLYVWLKLEWRGSNTNNNGQIRLSVRQAAQKMGVAIDTAAKAFQHLQAKGFIVMTEPAVLGVQGAAKAPAFELTELALPGQNLPSKRYLKWAAGSDFEVSGSPANNPTGRNGKTKSRPEI